MLLQTPALVLNQIRYQETSLIVRLLTPAKGMQSVIVQGVRHARPRLSPALFGPLYPIEAILYFKEQSELHRLKEARMLFPLHRMPFDVKASAMAGFMAECVYRLLRPGNPDEDLFVHLLHYTEQLDAGAPAGLHLSFLYELPEWMGWEKPAARLIDTLILGESDRVSAERFLVTGEAAHLTHHTLRSQMVSTLLAHLSHQAGYPLEMRSLPVLQSLFE